MQNNKEIRQKVRRLLEGLGLSEVTDDIVIRDKVRNTEKFSFAVMREFGLGGEWQQSCKESLDDGLTVGSLICCVENQLAV